MTIASLILALVLTASPQERYLVLPIDGQIGTDVTPQMVHDTLQFAVDHDVHHVVITVNTGGGFVPPAEACWNELHDYSDRLTYHGLLTKCISAGVWFAFSCDTLHITPTGYFGAASVYDTLPDNSVKLNEKSSAIFAAEIASRAELKGYSPVILRGMIVPGAEVWAWSDQAGERHVTNYRPDPGAYSDMTQLDSPFTLLTLTASEAELAGVAKVLRGGFDELGGALGYPDWARAGGFGEARSLVQKYLRNIEDFKQFNRNLKDSTNLLSWADNRTESKVPSLFGQPSPGMEAGKAQSMFDDMCARLDAAVQKAKDADPEALGLPPSPGEADVAAWRERRKDATAAWNQLETLAVGLENEYNAATGQPADLALLKHTPLNDLNAIWDRTEHDAGLPTGSP